MANDSGGNPWPTPPGSDLVAQASAVLEREVGRLGGARGQMPSIGGPALSSARETLTGIAGRVCPVTGAAVPLAQPDRNRLRQQAHELIEALLGTFAGSFAGTSAGSSATEGTYQHPAPYQNQVPLIQCLAPADAGGTAVARMTVANDEDAPAAVSLYCTNFVAD